MNYIQFADGAIPNLGYESGDFSISTLVDGGRNTQGDFIGQVIGSDKLKIGVTFKALSPVELQAFLKRFDIDQGGRFVNDFIVLDPRYNDFRRKTMYIGDRSGTPFRVGPNGIPKYWLNVKGNLIEV